MAACSLFVVPLFFLALQKLVAKATSPHRPPGRTLTSAFYQMPPARLVRPGTPMSVLWRAATEQGVAACPLLGMAA